jgi:hypothetical protein
MSERASVSPALGAIVLAPERYWSDDEGLHVDVRDLKPPEPMVAILALVQSAANDMPIIVHHDREPRLLYPELAERGWVAVPLDAPPGEVRLKLERAT